MKKIIALILCAQLLNLPAIASEIITDSFVEKTLTSKNIKKNESESKSLEDDFVNKTLKNNPKKDKENNKIQPIADNFAEHISIEKASVPNSQKTEIMKDEFAEQNLKTTKIVKHAKNQNFNYDIDKRIPVKISISEYLTTRQYLEEGQELEFRLIEDVNLNNSLVKEGSIVKARLETISMNQAFGTPADIFIEKFVIKRENQPDIELDGSIKKIGANRSLWVYPVGSCTLIFFFAGLVVYQIRGGHAKIKPDQIYEVYYVPTAL